MRSEAGLIWSREERQGGCVLARAHSEMERVLLINGVLI